MTVYEKYIVHEKYIKSIVYEKHRKSIIYEYHMKIYDNICKYIKESHMKSITGKQYRK